MILVFTIVAFLWGIGAVFHAPYRHRYIMILLLFAALVAIHLYFPATHPLRQNTGGDIRLWLIIGGFAGLIFIYWRGLIWLKSRQKTDHNGPKDTQKPALSAAQLERYSRHILLRDIGGEGQKRICESKVLVIGVGGLGSPALQYLAAAGVGTLGFIDDDLIEPSNLQRQTIHRDDAIGIPKVKSASAMIAAQNPFVQRRPYQRRFEADIATQLIEDYDLVLDCSDNFNTRRLVNATCLSVGRACIFGALSQWEGQVMVQKGAPCYECVFPNTQALLHEESCAQVGVFAALPGIIGTLMAAEALKIITGAGTPLKGRLLIYDALDATCRVIKTTKKTNCHACKSA